METKKKLPVGLEFFKDFKKENFYYVDKTGFIRELMEARGSVNLFTRPRRFGKSLNISMLKAFFEIGADPSVFDGLEIRKETALCEEHLGKYPVIFVSLKDISGASYKSALKKMSGAIKKEARRHQYLLESDKLSQVDRESLQPLYEPYIDETVQEESIYLLSEMLFKHYGRQVIILIDEYDVPLDKAYQKNYYPEMTDHIRAMLSEALKTNENLYFAVITGCLRIAKESVFTGLNHFKVRTVADIRYAGYFGFTDEEVRAMLCYYGLEEKYGELKDWYDGYHFGDTDIYCPWDIVNQCDKFLESKDAPMEAHWENSSSNAVVLELLEKATETTKDQMEALISGECVEKRLVPELTYTDLDSEDAEVCQTYLWSVLFATGYLTQSVKTENGLYRLVIPNREVQGIYEKKIYSWFRHTAVSHTARWRKFCKAVKTGNDVQVELLLNAFMAESVSIRDTCMKKDRKENFYHGLLLGLLQAEGSWSVKSNAESGTGYSDILLEAPAEKTGCVIEVKYAENGRYDLACYKAMDQIHEKQYTQKLKQDGMRVIHMYGISCYKKSCRVLYEYEE